MNSDFKLNKSKFILSSASNLFKLISPTPTNTEINSIQKHAFASNDLKDS